MSEPSDDDPFRHIGKGTSQKQPDEFFARMLHAARRSGQRGSECELLGKNLAEEARSLMDQFATIVGYNATLVDIFEGMLTSIIAKALAYGALGPLSNAARTVEKEPYVQGAKTGGKASGLSRKAKVKEGWEAIARKLAMGAPERLAAENTSASQDNIVADIVALWNSSEIRPPSHGHIKKLISRMQAADEMPRIAKRRS